MTVVVTMPCRGRPFRASRLQPSSSVPGNRGQSPVAPHGCVAPWAPGTWWGSARVCFPPQDAPRTMSTCLLPGLAPRRLHGGHCTWPSLQNDSSPHQPSSDLVGSGTTRQSPSTQGGWALPPEVAISLRPLGFPPTRHSPAHPNGSGHRACLPGKMLGLSQEPDLKKSL